MIVLDDIVVGVTCKNCVREVRRSIGWLKSHKAVVCVGCADEIEFDTGQLVRAAEKAQAFIDRTAGAAGAFPDRRITEGGVPVGNQIRT